MGDQLKPGDECPQCSGTGIACQCCASAIDECECGPDAEPSTCDLCDGRGFADEFMADCFNDLNDVESASQSKGEE